MARFNNKKLQTQRNFQSIWHSHPENIGTLLREDQLIREYIIGTMKAKEWKISEIIIKRKVKQIHIAFQIQNKIIKERKRWTKNRLKNRFRKRLKTTSARKAIFKKRYLFFLLFLMVTELRKMYPNNIITFYIQKTKPLQFNANLVSSWITANMKKRKSHARLINRVIRKYRKGVEKTHPSFKTMNSTWNLLKMSTKKDFLAWITGNLIYLYNTHNQIKNYSGVREYIDNNYSKSIEQKLIPSVHKSKIRNNNEKILTRRINNSENILIKRINNSENILIKRIYNSGKVGIIRGNNSGKFWIIRRNNNGKIVIKRRNNNGKIIIKRKKKIPFYVFWLKWRIDQRKKKLRGAWPGVRMFKRMKQIYYHIYKKETQSQRGKETKFQSGIIKGVPKRNIHILRNINLPLFKTDFNQNFISKKIHTFNKFNSLSMDQIYSSFISHPLFKHTKKKYVYKASKKVKKIKRNPLINKLLLYHMIELKLALIIKNSIKNKLTIWGSKVPNLASQLIFSEGKTSIFDRGLPSQNLSKHIAQMDEKDKFNINQDLRTTWRLTRKIPKIQIRLGHVKRRLWKEHRNNFKKDILLLSNYYRYLTKILSKDYSKDHAINFKWQSKNFIKFLNYHPPLLDHIIKCLINTPMFNLSNYNISSSDHLITFLTHVWIGFFDYIYHFENSLFKWQGIKIILKGRIGFKKMGRAKKYSKYWGVCNNSSARLPLQYNYTQIHTRYGAVGMHIFIR